MVNLLFVFAIYFYEISNLNTLQYSIVSDGFKNYFTTAWYLKNNAGFWFNGINFPFGENIIYTDNQPALAFILSPIFKTFPSLNSYLRGFISLLSFLSIPLCGAMLYQIYRLLKVETFTAFLFSIPVALLSPQIQRISGHYSLSYCFFIPLIIFFLLRFVLSNREHEKSWIYLLLSISFFTFIHVYYLALSIFYVVAFVLLLYFFKVDGIKKPSIKKLLLLILSVAVPLLFLKVFLLLTDPVTDRPKAPWGFLETRSQWSAVFFHPVSYLTILINNFFNFNPYAGITNEGYNFIGSVCTIVILFGFGGFVLKKLKNGYLFNLKPHEFILIAGIPTLLFALAFPFSIERFAKYYEWLPSTLKQFRSAGRFGIVFYYAAAIYTVVEISKWKLQEKKWGFFALLLIGVLWTVEANMYNVAFKKNMNWGNAILNLKEEENFIQNQLRSKGYSSSDFYGILHLPLHLVGSEKFDFSVGDGSLPMRLSLASNIPLLSGSMSRTSISNTMKIASLLADDSISKKEILQHYNTTKPILLAANRNERITEKGYEYLNAAQYLFSFKDLDIYKLPIEAIRGESVLKNYVLQPNSTNFSNVLHFDFDSLPSDVTFMGKGALRATNVEQMFYYDTLPNAKDSTWYSFSVWTLVDPNTISLPVVYVKEVDEKNNLVYGLQEAFGKTSTLVSGNWVMIKCNFYLQNKQNKVMMHAYADKGVYDELIMKPTQLKFEVANQSQSQLLGTFNNYPIFRQ